MASLRCQMPSITLEPVMGAWRQDCIEEAQELSRALDVEVQFTFIGDVYRVTPTAVYKEGVRI